MKLSHLVSFQLLGAPYNLVSFQLFDAPYNLVSFQLFDAPYNLDSFQLLGAPYNLLDNMEPACRSSVSNDMLHSDLHC